MAARTLNVARRVVTDDLRRLHVHLLVALAVILAVELLALLLGWDALTRVESDWPQIYPYTIAGMAALVAAMALFRLHRPWATWTGRGLATVTLVLGAGVDIGVGAGILPSSDPTSSTAAIAVTALPSLAAVATALAVLLITTVRPVWVWIRLGLLTFAGAVSALVVLGYLYGSSLLITTLGLTGTSLPAALIGMVILAAAVTARPDQAPLRDLDERYDTRLLRTIVPMLAVAPFVPALISAAVTAVLPDAAAAAAVAQLITAAILIGLIAVLGTAQSRARRELLMQRQRVWDAFEQSPAATAIVSLDGRIATANRALVSLTKRPEDALIGTLLPDLISDADHVRMWEAVAEVAAGLDSVRRDVRFRGSGRTSTWVDLTLAAVRDSNDRVIYLILTCTDLSDRKQLERVLSEQAVHDPLTGLLNRIGLDHQIDVLWRSRAPRERVVVVVVDINDLAAVNESLGFAAGDDVLREVSRRLRACTRTEDLLARPSGDEFIVVTTVVTDDPVGTGSVVQRIREELSGPVAAGRDVVPLNVTVGATTLSDLAQILGVWEPGDAPPMLSPTRRATDRSDHR